MFKSSRRLVIPILGLLFGFIVIFTSPGSRITAGEFTDIQGNWAQGMIKHLASIHAVSQNPDGTFRPDSPITRAEFAAMLVNAFKLQPKNSVIVFMDTYKHWAKDYISNAVAYSLVSGYDELHFGPDDPVTREQMAVMIANACKLEGSFTGIEFKDSSQISEWARQAVAAATQKRLLNGYPDNTFRPQNLATRAQAAAVIDQALKVKH